MIEEDISALEEHLDNLLAFSVEPQEVFSVEPKEVWTKYKRENMLVGYCPLICLGGEEIWRGLMIPVDPPVYISSFTEKMKASEIAFNHLHSRLRSMLTDEEI